MSKDIKNMIRGNRLINRLYSNKTMFLGGHGPGCWPAIPECELNFYFSDMKSIGFSCSGKAFFGGVFGGY